MGGPRTGTCFETPRGSQIPTDGAGAIPHRARLFASRIGTACRKRKPLPKISENEESQDAAAEDGAKVGCRQ